MPTITHIKKRDGRIVDFDQSKIASAIWKAAESVGGTDRTTAERIANQITAVIEVFFKGPEATPTVEQIQDLVEKILIEGGHAKTAKAYILYRAEQARRRERERAPEKRELFVRSASPYTLPVPDSIDGIFETLKDQAHIHLSGGETSLSFSRLSGNPISTMKIFDVATQEIRQDGKRPGTNTGVLRVDHPEILNFIVTKLPNFKLSIAITGKFMEALRKDTPYNLIHPQTKVVVAQLRAREVWGLITQNAWLNGDLGLIYIDHINNSNPVAHLGEIETGNLLPYDSSQLGTIAVDQLVVTSETEEKDFNWSRLRETVIRSVTLLDKAIDTQHYPLQALADMSKSTRRLGLGITGFADALEEMMIPYDSDEALEKAEELMKFIQEVAIETSTKLAEKDGTFGAFEGSRWEEHNTPLRNAYLTAIDGHGIEPKTSVSTESRIRMQAAFQKYCCAPISTTITLTHGATMQEVERAYTLAYDLNCQGITIHRDKTARALPIHIVGKTEPEISETQPEEQKAAEFIPPPITITRTHQKLEEPRPAIIQRASQVEL